MSPSVTCDDPGTDDCDFDDNQYSVFSPTAGAADAQVNTISMNTLVHQTSHKCDWITIDKKYTCTLVHVHVHVHQVHVHVHTIQWVVFVKEAFWQFAKLKYSYIFAYLSLLLLLDSSTQGRVSPTTVSRMIGRCGTL